MGLLYRSSRSKVCLIYILACLGKGNQATKPQLLEGRQHWILSEGKVQLKGLAVFEL